MNNQSLSAEKTKGIKMISSKPRQKGTALSSVLNSVLGTREIRQLLITIVPEFLDAWSGNSRIKKVVSGMAGYVVDKQLSRSDDLFEYNELGALFTDETFVKNFAALLPGLLDTLRDALSESVKTLDAASLGTQKELLDTLFSGSSESSTGELVTSAARILCKIHEIDPKFFAVTLEPAVQKWIASVDFAEIKEAVDGSGEDVLAFVEMVNSVIWQYPSKVIGIFSLLPSAANVIAGALNISVEKLNAVPPDLLTDIITSLLEEIDPEQVGEATTQISEIIRKLHVGSALLGEPGAPQLENALALKIQEIISHVDPIIAWKGRVALARLKASIDDGLTDAVAGDPKLLKLSMTNGPELSNVRKQSLNKWLSVLENQDDEAFENLLNVKLSAVDTQESAEGINSVIRIINRLWEQNPGICKEFVRQFINGIDDAELAFTASSLLDEIGEELKPVARSFVPGLVQWGCEVLAPRDDEYEEQAQQAREALKSLLIPEEV